MKALGKLGYRGTYHNSRAFLETMCLSSSTRPMGRNDLRLLRQIQKELTSGNSGLRKWCGEDGKKAYETKGEHGWLKRRYINFTRGVNMKQEVEKKAREVSFMWSELRSPIIFISSGPYELYRPGFTGSSSPWTTLKRQCCPAPRFMLSVQISGTPIT